MPELCMDRIRGAKQVMCVLIKAYNTTAVRQVDEIAGDGAYRESRQTCLVPSELQVRLRMKVVKEGHVHQPLRTFH